MQIHKNKKILTATSNNSTTLEDEAEEDPSIVEEEATEDSTEVEEDSLEAEEDIEQEGQAILTKMMKETSNMGKLY